jgi:ATP-dependent protease ClpP protease subunit
MADTIYTPIDLYLVGELTDASTLEFLQAFRNAHNEYEEEFPIRINLCCSGGEMGYSFAIVSQIHEYRRQGRRIITHCSSEAFSGGMTILQAGSWRTIDSFASLMTHTAQIILRKWEGNFRQLKATGESTDAINERAIQIVADRTGHSMDWLRENFFNADENYFDAIIALENNLVDEIISAPTDH